MRLYRRGGGVRGGGAYGKPQTHIGLEGREAKICMRGEGRGEREGGRLGEKGILEIQATNYPIGFLETSERE